MNWVSYQVWEPSCIWETVVSDMLIWYCYLMLVMLLAALWYSTDTLVDLHQLSKRCRRSHRYIVLDFKRKYCLNCQYGCSRPQILLMNQDHTSFTLNFKILPGGHLVVFWLFRQPMKQIKRMVFQSYYFAPNSNISDCDHKYKYPKMKTGDWNRWV